MAQRRRLGGFSIRALASNNWWHPERAGPPATWLETSPRTLTSEPDVGTDAAGLELLWKPGSGAPEVFRTLFPSSSSKV